jgi:hypothetical protein
MNPSNEKQNDWSKRELGALWRVDGKNQSFYSGEIKVDGKPVKIVCFTNKNKQSNSNQPDLRIYASTDD